MNNIIKLLIALSGVLVAVLHVPVWLTLFMLILITGLLADGFFKAAKFLKQEQEHCKRLYRIYKRQRSRSDWPDKKPDQPLIQYKEWKWWKL